MTPELQLPLRSLPYALAHYYAETLPWEQDRLTVLNRLFNSLSPAGQMMCRWELHETKAAKRGERLAELSEG
jgi:hypothetical protein